MSFVAKLTIGFAVMVTIWFMIVASFAMDDVSVERALSVGAANLPTPAGAEVNTTTTGTFSLANVRDISFVRRFFITVYDMPWWFNVFLGLINGLGLFLITVLWVLKIIHGDG